MSDVTTDFPTTTDDSGTGRDGTVFNEAWVDGVIDAINTQVLSATNPTLKPADTIDEVVTARGSKASLDARLDVSINEDGTLKSSSLTSYVTLVQFLGGLGGVNLVPNDDFLLWPDGDSSAPDGDTLSGAGATIARCGTGLADTTRKVGDFCAKITRAAADAKLTRQLLSGASFTRGNYIIGLYACGGMWVKCSTPNVARVAIYDGAGYTYSAYHTGGGTFEFLPVARQINALATELSLIECVDNAATNAHFSGRTLMLLDASASLPRYVPTPAQKGTIHFALSGNLAGTTNAARMTPGRSGIVTDVQLYAKTAPTGQAAIFDLNTWDGAALTSMFSTRPQIAAAGNVGQAAPDTTYARRCLRTQSGSSLVVGGLLSLDVDQVGSGVAGADASIDVRVLQYQTPLDKF